MSLSLSLLAKGIGQVSKNGNERLDVFLEPEDYYNLESKYRNQLAALRRQATQLEHESTFRSEKAVPLHKTFVTRKGALLLFSEELAHKSHEDEHKPGKKAKDDANLPWEIPFSLSDVIEEEEGEQEDDEDDHDNLRTCHDLSWAILNYGSKPEYRKKGEELYLRFLHKAQGTVTERKIRPGFSPKRYISTWSHQWDDGMLQKLRTNGLISDKTLFRQNPLLPHLYKMASYNLSANPPPYRVTRSMLLPTGNVPSYEFYRVKAQAMTSSEPGGSVAGGGGAMVAKAPPPSQQEAPPRGGEVIQAVKFHDDGNIQEVAYSDLRPQEKQEILAELLIAAHEHQKNIRSTLDLVITARHPPERSEEQEEGSSAASELMADMHRAILSLVESPVKQQMRERRKLIEEQERRLEEERLEQERKEERRRKKKEQKERERREKKEREREERRKKKEEQLKVDGKKEEVKEERPPPDVKEQIAVEAPPAGDDPKEAERREKEERRRKRREEREERELRRRQRKEKQEEEKRRNAEAETAAAHEKAERERLRREQEDVERERRHRRRHKHQRHQPDDHAGETPEISVETEKGKERRIRHQRQREAAEADIGHEVRASGHVRGPTTHQVSSELRHPADHAAAVQEIYYGHASGGSKAGSVASSKQRAGHVDGGLRHQVLRHPRRRDDVTDNLIMHVPQNTPSEHSQRSKSHAAPPKLIVAQSRPSSEDSGSEGGHLMAARVRRKGSSPQQGISHPSSASHSSAPKQVLFQAPIPSDDGKQSVKSRKGAMPITSKLVRQTLADKVSILSASQGASLAGSDVIQADVTHAKSSKSSPRFSGNRKQSHFSSEISVPSIGIEPATPMLHPEAGEFPTTGSRHLAASSTTGSRKSIAKSASTGGGGEGDFPERKQDGGREDGGSLKRGPGGGDGSGDDSDQSDDDLSKTSSMTSSKKQRKLEVASKSSQTTSSRKSKLTSTDGSSTTQSGSKVWQQPEAEVPHYGMKGSKGPGSQASSSFLKSSKKSSSRRGLQVLGGGSGAALGMPGGQLVPVGGSIARSSDKVTEEEPATEDDTETESQEQSDWGAVKEAPVEVPKPALKSAKSTSEDSSDKADKKVSFREERQVVTLTPHDVTETEVSDVTETEDEETEEDQDWPEAVEPPAPEPAVDDNGRISSRSANLTKHAQKVAALVVKKQRPDSGLDDDAKEAAALWNQKLQEETDGEEDDEEVVESEDDDDDDDDEATSSEGTDNAFKQAAEQAAKHAEEEKERIKRENLKKAMEEAKKEKEIKATEPAPTTAFTKKKSSVKSISSVETSSSSSVQTFVSEMQRKASEAGVKELHVDEIVKEKIEKSNIKPDNIEVVHDKKAGQHKVVLSRHSSASSMLTPTSGEDTAEPTPRRASKQKLVVDIQEKLSDQSAAASHVSSRTSSVASARSGVTTPVTSPRHRKASIPSDHGDDVQLDYDVTTYNRKLGDPKPEVASPRTPVEPEKIKAPILDKLKSEAKKPGRADSVKSGGSGKKQPVAHTKGPLRAAKAEGKPAGSVAGDSVASDVKSTRKGRKGKEKPTVEPVRTSPEKPVSKTPETPFRAGRPKEVKKPEEPVLPPSPEQATKAESISSQPKSKKGEKKGKGKGKDPVTQVEKDGGDAPKLKKKKAAPEPQEEAPKAKTPPAKSPLAKSPAKTPAREPSVADEYDDVTPLPAESPVDEYDFVRVEDEEEEEEELVEEVAPEEAEKMDDLASEITEATETTEHSSQHHAQSAEEEAEREAEREAKRAAKADREQRRAAAAEKRKQEVERKRREKEDLLRKEKEEQERQEQMKEQLESERRRREEMQRQKKEDMEREKLREKEEEELRKRRAEQAAERERRMMEERRKKMEEMQRKKKEEEEKKREQERLKREEEAELLRQEQEMLSQMADEERAKYEEEKRIAEAERKERERERRLREEEEAKIAMEHARIQAMIKAKEQADLEEKLRFVREFFQEANGLDQTQNVNRAFTFSYFELMVMLGLDKYIE